ncbi:MAG: histidine kinase [Flavobacterium sp.]|uniref:sensor histidine kinase n=1 Tax=Flavobacterium sp. TaxID=239 RepID=UPI003264938A
MNKEIALGIIIGLLFVTLVVMFCVLLVKLYIKKIKEHNQKEIAFQKTLNTTIIETQEQVLNNISQDLHDDAGQQLTSINFQLENLKLDSPELAKTLAPVSKSVGQLSQSIRSISHSLNNQLVMQQDVIKAIATEIKRLQKNKKVTIHYSFEELVSKKFSDHEKIFIYRIFQECINNALKHSKASIINITIRTKPEYEMVFSDNGVGFDLKTSPDKISMGLTSMKNRALDIHYILNIESEIGEGTTITLNEIKPD